ncbi:MAG: molecular chaperone TorD family protein [Coriobacteriales bacterium]|jgi:TorA maturation chaperone TorD|nr:molecular chaperone TorD family protein [Coriobacteriales bacterium]
MAFEDYHEDYHEDYREFMADRESMYSFLAKVFFSELSDEAIKHLATVEVATEYGNPHIANGLRSIRNFFMLSKADRRVQLATEYARIFLAAGVYTQTRSVAVPYESVFTSEERLMFQDARDEVRATYQRCGFELDVELREPEDHLSFELEFLAHMARRSSDCIEQKRYEAFPLLIMEQKDFIEQHLLNWIPDLIQTAKRYAKNTFYPGMLLITWGYLEDDCEFLEELLEREGLHAERATDQSAERATNQVVGLATDQAVGLATGQSAKRVTDQSVGQATSQVFSQTVSQVATRRAFDG